MTEMWGLGSQYVTISLILFDCGFTYLGYVIVHLFDAVRVTIY